MNLATNSMYLFDNLCIDNKHQITSHVSFDLHICLQNSVLWSSLTSYSYSFKICIERYSNHYWWSTFRPHISFWMTNSRFLADDAVLFVLKWSIQCLDTKTRWFLFSSVFLLRMEPLGERLFCFWQDVTPVRLKRTEGVVIESQKRQS